LLGFETGPQIPQTTFAVRGGINFLGSAFLAAQVSVTKGSDGGTIMTGTLTAAQALTPFGVLSCGFSNTSHPDGDSEFAIDEWPEFTWARNLIDFVAAIKALADTGGGSPCGTLADFVVSNAYSTSFSISPSVSVSGSNLVFALTGTDSLTL